MINDLDWNHRSFGPFKIWISDLEFEILYNFDQWLETDLAHNSSKKNTLFIFSAIYLLKNINFGKQLSLLSQSQLKAAWSAPERRPNSKFLNTYIF